MDWTGIGGIVAALAVGAWRFIDKHFEKKRTREYGLSENPARCLEHTRAINELKADVKAIKAHLGIV